MRPKAYNLILASALGLCFFLRPISTNATVAYVQTNNAVPSIPQTTVTVTYTAAQTAGNLNVVAVGWNDTTASVSSVIDSEGNTYTLAVGPTQLSGVVSQSIYYAKNIAAAAANANTVTVTFSTAAAYPDIRILEYSGLDPSGPVDVTAGASGTGASSNSGMATTTNANDLIFGANIVTTTTTGAGSGFTSRVITSPDGDIAEDETVSTTGSYGATAPLYSGGWVMQMVAFRAAGSGPSISSLSPTSGAIGTSVTITGTNFGATTGSWSTVQHPYNNSCSGATCTVTLTQPTGSGNGIILAMTGASTGSAPTFSSASSGVGTWVNCTSCYSTKNDGTYNLFTIMAYVTSSNAGVSSITLTLSNSLGIGETLEAIEVSWSGTNIAFDTGGTNTSTGCTSCTGVGLTLSGSSDYIVQSGAPDQNYTAITGGAFTSTAFGDFYSSAVAAAANTTNGTAPTWTQSSGSPSYVAMSGIALKGTSNTVTFNGTTATPTSWSNTSIVAAVPTGATTGNVVVSVGGVNSNGVSFTVSSGGSPSISSLSPTSGSVGTSVTISGTNFGSTPGSWTTIQHPYNSSCSGSTCIVTLSQPTGSGNGVILVATGGIMGSAPTFSSASSGVGTWINCTSCYSSTFDGTYYIFGIISYLTNSNSGVSSISMTVSSTPASWTLEAIEVSWSGTNIAFDTGGSNASTGCTSCTGVSLTPSGSSDYIVQAGSPDQNYTAITGAAFSSPSFADFYSSAVAAAINTTNGSAPTWSQSSGSPNYVAMSALALMGSSSTLKFNGTAAIPTSWSSTSIVAPVPTGATTGNVVVNVGGVNSNGVSFTVSSGGSPSISSLSPTSGSVGTSVTITGTNFGATQGSSTVSFSGTTATPTSWGSTGIVAPVPTGASTGYVIVTVSGTPSNGVTFTVTSDDSGSSGVYYYFEDHLGTSRVITNSSGTVCYDADFYPFGGERAVTVSCDQNYKFTGKERDTESNLDYFGARHYSSSFGRFMSPDPLMGNIADPQSLNRYSYVRNSPLSLVDPLGLQPSDGGDCGDFDCGGCDTDFGCGGSVGCDPSIFCGGGGGNGGQPPISTPPDIPNDPDPPAGDPDQLPNDPFSGETFGIPNGIQLPVGDFGFLLGIPDPSDLIINNFSNGSWSSWWNQLKNLSNNPWMVSWIFPILGEPGVAGIGPAGSVAWNPKTRTLCVSVGIGASVGDNIAAGPIGGRTTTLKPASPDQLDKILAGPSLNFGVNAPTGPVPLGPGGQISVNGSGAVFGPAVGVAGASGSLTSAACGKL